MPNGRLHHLGFVVANLNAGMAGFTLSLAAGWDGQAYEDPFQKVKVAFLVVSPGEASIELVEPAAEDSPVRRFLEKTGGGLHHVCYEVEDLSLEIAEMKSRKAMLIRKPKPAVAFAGRNIAWMLTAENLLVEFLEKGFRPTA